MKITREKANKLLRAAAISQTEQEQAEIAEKLDISAGIFMSALKNSGSESGSAWADEAENGLRAGDKAFCGERRASLADIREDTVVDGDSKVRERIMSQAPRTEDGYFAVPKTVG